MIWQYQPSTAPVPVEVTVMGQLGTFIEKHVRQDSVQDVPGGQELT